MGEYVLSRKRVRTVGVGRKKVPVKLNVEKDNELWEELKSCRKVVPVYHVTVICAK